MTLEDFNKWLMQTALYTMGVVMVGIFVTNLVILFIDAPFLLYPFLGIAGIFLVVALVRLFFTALRRMFGDGPRYNPWFGGKNDVS